MKFELMIQENTLTPEQFEAWACDQEFCSLEWDSTEPVNKEYLVWISPNSYEDAQGFGEAVTDLMRRSIEGL
jgi:hypothetical protein